MIIGNEMNFFPVNCRLYFIQNHMKCWENQTLLAVQLLESWMKKKAQFSFMHHNMSHLKGWQYITVFFLKNPDK